MNSKNISLFMRCMLALFLAVQVWVWLRFAGALWLSDSMGLMVTLVKSVTPLKTALDAFLILVVPATVVSFLIHGRSHTLMRLAIYTFLGSLYSTIYLLLMAGLNFSFIEFQMWVYIVAGGVSGLGYGAILDLPWKFRSSLDEHARVSHARRKLLGTLGIFAGSGGFLGTLAGPFYFWKNRNNYVDVNIARLEDGQLMTIELANKPVWVLKRSPEMIRLLEQDNPKLLDPLSLHSKQPEQASNSLRSIRPEYLVVYGICTHLGCAPSYEPQGRANENPFSGQEPQFYCSCHGGVFDLAGRVYKGTPPPVNMVVPPHEFVSEEIVRLYYPSLKEEWNA